MSSSLKHGQERTLFLSEAHFAEENCGDEPDGTTFLTHTSAAEAIADVIAGISHAHLC